MPLSALEASILEWKTPKADSTKKQNLDHSSFAIGNILDNVHDVYAQARRARVADAFNSLHTTRSQPH